LLQEVKCHPKLRAAPRNSPLCVHAESTKELTKGSGRPALFTAGASRGLSLGQVQMQVQNTPLLCSTMCSPHLETERCGRHHS